MFETLKSVILSNDTKWGRRFDLFIQFLIVTSLLSFCIDTLPNITESTKSILGILEITIVLIFTVEYLLRVILTKRKIKFIFSFYGIIDLLAILPFYLTTGIDLRSVRALRLMRLFRVLKLIRYNRALGRFKSAVNIIREELILFFALAMILLFISGAGIYIFEHAAQPDVFKSIFDSIWWAVILLTTVGYGDIIPITAGGKIFTFFMLMIGIGIIAVPTGLFASAISKARELEKKEKLNK